MLRALSSGVSGIQQFQNRLDVIGNNIANSNTIAFKAARTDFSDAFSQTLQVSSASSSGSNQAGMQVGSGVTTAAVKNIFTQGALNRTGVGTDLAIDWRRLLHRRDPVSGIDYATRAGDFRLDANGYLITNKGLRVQGYNTGNNTSAGSRGDIQINADPGFVPATIDPAATMTTFSIGPDGGINVQMSDGSEFLRATITLQRFSDTQALLKEGDNLFSGIGAAGHSGAQPLPRANCPTPTAWVKSRPTRSNCPTWTSPTNSPTSSPRSAASRPAPASSR
jgi:flagellar hook protein FlgE